MTTTDLGDLTPLPENILSVYRRATPEQIAEGVSWYADAHSFARALDPYDVERAAGVIAALSPRTQWRRNMILAARAFSDGFASGTIPHSCACADRILRGERFTDVLRGNKVLNFAHVITDPTHPSAVAIDRHAVSIAIGRKSTDRDTKVLDRVGVYDQYASAYRVAAGTVGVSPSQVQAVTWVVWRAERGIA